MFSDSVLGLYIHWPFCMSKCPYCDFNSYVSDEVDHERWAELLSSEMETLADKSEKKVNLTSIFIGGGTPSLMKPASVESLLKKAQDVFGFAPHIEITMEANPTSLEAGRLESFAKTGVNRLSLGIQSLNDDALKMLGRNHSAREALKALETAQKIFPKTSADFIYARPGQETYEWQEELTQILSLGLSHLSLYQLTLEPGTAFYSQHKRGNLTIPDNDTARELFDVTQSLTCAAGLDRYEISNHAKPDHHCEHNLIYWRAQNWIGIGPGAYGRYWIEGKRMETQCERNPSAWCDSVKENGHGLKSVSCESEKQATSEILMMGLRLSEGVSLERIPQAHINQNALDKLAEDDFIMMENERIRIAPHGIPLINSILNTLIN